MTSMWTSTSTLTYAGFLAIFLGLPLIVLLWLTRRDYAQNRELPPSWRGAGPRGVLVAHILLAVVYTTPWDNYLVASRVWYYDPARVLAVTLGWVPIEEYTFFVLQTLVTGLWLLWLARRAPAQGNVRRLGDLERTGLWPAPPLRLWAGGTAGLIWLVSVGMLFWGQAGATYLALILAWMLPPVALQLAVGADTLWRCRRQVALSLLPPVLYLSAADALAIAAGVWTINPARSTGLLLGGVLPVEEFVFFTITNVLIVFGMTLMLVRGREFKEALRVAQAGTR